MRTLPSMPTAIVTGAVVMPLFMWGCHFIDATLHSQSLLFPWGLVAFVAPILLATFDFSYARRRWREVGFFRPLASREDFQLLYIPAWIRMGVLFVSAVISMLGLKAIGVDF